MQNKIIKLLKVKHMNDTQRINEKLLSKEELALINNALNEILNGAYAIDREEFQTLTGSTPEEAEKLLEKIHILLESER